MCYSAESSIQSFSLVSILSGLLYYYGNKFDKHVAIAFFTIIQMQLAEYLMWLDQSCGVMNKYATIYAYIVLIMQPLAILLSGYYLKTLNISQNYLIGSIFIIAIPWIYGLLQYVFGETSKCSTPKNGHLLWDFLRNKEYYPNALLLSVYFIGLFLPWLFMKDFIRGYFMFFLLVISFAIHYYMYNDNWHTKWCFGTRAGTILYIAFIFLYPMLRSLLKN